MKRRFASTRLPVRASVFCILLLFAQNPIFGQAKEGDITFKIEKLRRLWFEIVPSGLDVSLTYYAKPIIEDVDTKYFFMVGGGYEEKPLYRSKDGSPITQEEVMDIANSDSSLKALKYRTPNAQWEFGIIQGITWNERLKMNGLETFLLVRECIDVHYIPEEWNVSSYLMDSHSPFGDQEGVFYNSFFGGFAYNGIEKDSHDRRSGIYGEASCEWAPPWFANDLFGEASFTRLNGQGKFFSPLFDAFPDAEKNILSGYWGTFFCVDYVFGDAIPIFVSQSLGGRKLKKALGGAVRGFEKRSIDANLKIAWNNELRLNGPVILGTTKEGIVPILFLYWDSGDYRGFPNAPEAFRDSSGFLFSTGVGTALDLFGVGQVRMTLDIPIFPERLDGSPVHLDFDVGLQF